MYSTVALSQLGYIVQILFPSKVTPAGIMCVRYADNLCDSGIEGCLSCHDMGLLRPVGLVGVLSKGGMAK